MDRFLDSHPDVDKTLRANPWLVRNATYLKEHPELQTFLNQHPGLKEESAETPKYLMQREQQFDARERGRQDRDRDFDRDRDANAHVTGTSIAIVRPIEIAIQAAPTAIWTAAAVPIEM